MFFLGIETDLNLQNKHSFQNLEGWWIQNQCLFIKIPQTDKIKLWEGCRGLGLGTANGNVKWLSHLGQEFGSF
jgi:hypothetical protein